LRILLGRPLANREYEARKIGPFEAVPAMGLDGLASSAYGPEAALSILAPLGAASLAFIGGVMGLIVGLLAILFVSYWQTIAAYPNNGGAYIVSKENLGANASLLAAAALMIDYVLNVAVGISAGVAALVSAVPQLFPLTLPLCLAILGLITVANLRGTMDAGRFFALPTYLFVASFVGIIALGAARAIASSGHPTPVVAPPSLGPSAESASLWLLARAFASGCTAMTGVEAVSNGMTAFRQPHVRNGHVTLALIVGALATLLIGVAYLATAYHVGAMDQTKAGYRSVLSQLAAAVVGRGPAYFVAMASALAVLALSANTSFVDFPRLCRMVAEDGFLPAPFAAAGRRLVFSVGILYLAGAAALLLIVFGGVTDRLIPLFAIGAFLTFTLSQTGMVFHWRRALGDKRAGGRISQRAHLAINAVGGASTGLSLVVIVVAKFVEGAWITVLVIPAVILLLKRIGAYYQGLARSLAHDPPLDLRDTRPPILLVAIEDWNKVSEQALELALSLSPEVIAIHLTELTGPEAEAEDDRLQADWRAKVEAPARDAGFEPPKLMVLMAEYRTLHRPVLKVAEDLCARFPGRRVAVLLPRLAQRRWYEYLLHAHRADRLRAELLKRAADVTLIEAPWRR